MIVGDLGIMRYRQAWSEQERAHAAVAAGAEEQLLLVEHPPVITLGRRADAAGNLIASDAQLAGLGVEVVQTDRGGDITFHGPGQIVAYPMVRLIDHQLSVGGYVRRLEQAAVAALAELGVESRADPAAIGVWVEREGQPAKICALGVRIRRGVSMHGIALNVTTDLRYFDLIVPCGLKGKAVTSLRQVMGEKTPEMERVKAVLARRIQEAFAVPRGE
jgi:lipoyl(octanoyl) transferase